MSRKIRIVHIINSFEFGGAEAMLCNLLLRTDRDRFDPFVVSLIDDLTVAAPVLAAGIPLVTMGMKPGIPDPRAVVRLARYLRGVRPAVIQTWMDHSNLIGGLAARVASRAALVWGIHHCEHVRGLAKRSTLMTVSACGMMSSLVPSRIVFCSEHARTRYGERGFAAERSVVIPNGFDTDRFRPDPSARIDLRRELGIGPNTPLVGLVARYDPVKDHASFLRAAALLVKERPEVRFLLCGAGVDRRNAALTTLIDSLGLNRHCHLLGPRNDVPRVYASLDILASSSISEAFPLVLGEAMACVVPCVATDVGDSALIVGPAGRIVPPRDPAALAAAWAELLSLTPEARGDLALAARQRIRERFDLGGVTRRYEALYEQLASRERPTAGAPAMGSIGAGPVAAMSYS